VWEISPELSEKIAPHLHERDWAISEGNATPCRSSKDGQSTTLGHRVEEVIKQIYHPSEKTQEPEVQQPHKVIKTSLH
jgi:hypothetical protein